MQLEHVVTYTSYIYRMFVTAQGRSSLRYINIARDVTFVMHCPRNSSLLNGWSLSAKKVATDHVRGFITGHCSWDLALPRKLFSVNGDMDRYYSKSFYSLWIRHCSIYVFFIFQQILHFPRDSSDHCLWDS